MSMAMVGQRAAQTPHPLQDAVKVRALRGLNPFAVILVSILFGALIVSGREIQPSGVSFLIQGIILFLVISSDVLLKYTIRVVRTNKDGEIIEKNSISVEEAE